MSGHRNLHPREHAASVAAAIRERIMHLEAELAHWREALRECEDALRGADAPPPTPKTGAKPR